MLRIISDLRSLIGALLGQDSMLKRSEIAGKFVATIIQAAIPQMRSGNTEAKYLWPFISLLYKAGSGTLLSYSLDIGKQEYYSLFAERAMSSLQGRFDTKFIQCLFVLAKVPLKDPEFAKKLSNYAANNYGKFVDSLNRYMPRKRASYRETYAQLRKLV